VILINGQPVTLTHFPNKETLVPQALGTLKFANPREFDPTPTLTLKYESDEDLLHLYFVRSLFPRAKLCIRYMPYSRMDRSAGGLAFTLRDVARFINSMMFDSVAVEEPHSDVTCALLDRSTPVYVTKDLLLPQVWEKLGFAKPGEEPGEDFDEGVLIYPDAGAQKRYADVKGYTTSVAFKHRDPETGAIEDVELVGLPHWYSPGWQALIIDDLVCKGGTFIPLAQKLRDLGAEKVHLLVAHCEPAMFGADLLTHIDSLWCTDSMFPAETIFYRRPDEQDYGPILLKNLVKAYPKLHVFSEGEWVE
jgi:ribose-phosphate pyrophosphokinase